MVPRDGPVRGGVSWLPGEGMGRPVIWDSALGWVFGVGFWGLAFGSGCFGWLGRFFKGWGQGGFDVGCFWDFVLGLLAGWGRKSDGSMQ